MKTKAVLAASPWVLAFTLIVIFVVPRQFWFYCFIMPMVYACVVLSKGGTGFNGRLFMGLLLAAVVLPSGFFTLDLINITPGDADVLIAPTHEVIITMVAGPSTNPALDIVLMASFWVNLAVVILVFVIPVVMIIAIVVNLVNPVAEKDTAKSMSGLMKAALVMIVFIVACIILDFFNLLPEWFFWHYIRDFVIWVVEIASWLGTTIASWFNPNMGLPAFPAFPTGGGIGLGQITAAAGSYMPLSAGGATGVEAGTLPWLFFNINVAIPIVLAIVPVIIYQQYKRGRNPYTVLDQVFEDPLDTEITGVRFNLPAMVFAAVVLVYAFAVFLNFGEPGLDIGLYTVISMFAFVLLAVGALPVRTGSGPAFIEGLVVGTGGILFFFNLASTGLTVLPSEELPAVITIANQILFVAPTESLLFHVVLPGLALLGMYLIYERNRKRHARELSARRIATLEERQAKLRLLYQSSLESSTRRIEYQGQRMTSQELTTQIFNLENMIVLARREASRRSTTTVNTILAHRIGYVAYFVVVAMVVPNVLFSTYHAFRSAYDVVSFWVSGLAFIYFGAGCWLTFICVRYGWLACVMSHALVNVISLLMMGVFV